jgi:ferric-dicitrate binding protein FerR (iron transport regulator)
MDLTKYASLTIAELLEDDAFVKSVLEPTAESVQFWQRVGERYPAQQATMAQATWLLRAYRTQDTFVSPQQAEIWQRIEAEVGPAATGPLVLPRATRRWPRALRLAAALVPLGLAGSLAVWYNQEQRVETAFGELKTVDLPDGTRVVLNGNSTLTYHRGWGQNVREAWLQGEGFFKVVHLNQDSTHIRPGERFVVHCNNLNIEVLGTTFNVVNRHADVRVGLVTGKVRLTATTPTGPATSLVLAPGEVAEYAAKSLVLTDKLTHPEKLASWSKRQFVFRNGTLGDILKSLEDTHGYRVRYTHAAARQLKIEGDINVASVQELLQTISTILHVSIYQNDKQITVN